MGSRIDSDEQKRQLNELFCGDHKFNISDLQVISRVKYEIGQRGFCPDMLWVALANIAKATNKNALRQKIIADGNEAYRVAQLAKTQTDDVETDVDAELEKLTLAVSEPKRKGAK